MPSAPRDSIRSLRVLVVDDSRNAADSLALLLDADGHHARAEYNGATALAAAEEFLPEVVLCDLEMPGMDGYEVARRLRAQTRDQQLLLVALTGRGSDEDRRRTLEAGFDFHLVKPVNLERLDDILKRP